MSASANIGGSDDQMDIEEDESNQPADPMFQKNQQTMFNRPPPKIFGQNPMPSNDFPNKDNSRGSNFDDISNSGNSSMDRDNDMNDFGRGRGPERDRDRNNRTNRRDYSNERGGTGGGRNSNNSRWSDGRGRSRESDRITPSDGNSRDFNNSRNSMQWRDSQPNFNNTNSFLDQPNARMNQVNMSAGPPPALEDMRLPIPIDNLRSGPMGGPNGMFQIHMLRVGFGMMLKGNLLCLFFLY